MQQPARGRVEGERIAGLATPFSGVTPQPLLDFSFRFH
jgi:hypothetical protein